jgi:glycerol-3-phosphate dehydrogenase (NAD(P)+)
MKTNIAVIGGGSWATAIVKMLSNNCEKVLWWMRDEEQVEHIKKFGHNPKYLTSAEFNNDVVFPSIDLIEVITSSDMLIIATPSAFIHHTFNGIDLSGKKIVSAVKGIIPQTNEIPADYFQNGYGLHLDDFAIICGPCHAEEVAMERLSYLTIAGKQEGLCQNISDLLSCRYIRCTLSNDVVGAEISAVLKNVYALAGGISHGLGYGDNYLSVLISNAIQEIERFIDAVYPLERDVKLSAYLGDLLVTAYSPHSRNRTFGNMIGKGYSVRAIQQEMNMIAEGYYAASCIQELNKKYKVDLPIANTVFEILYNKANAKKAFEGLSLLLA